MLGFTAVKLHLLLLQWRVCFSGSLGKSLVSLLLFLVVANSRGSKAERWRRSIPRKVMRWITMQSLLGLLPSPSSRTPRRRKMKRRMRIWYDVFLCLVCLLDCYASLLALLWSTKTAAFFFSSGFWYTRSFFCSCWLASNPNRDLCCFQKIWNPSFFPSSVAPKYYRDVWQD